MSEIQGFGYPFSVTRLAGSRTPGEFRNFLGNPAGNR